MKDFHATGEGFNSAFQNRKFSKLFSFCGIFLATWIRIRIKKSSYFKLSDQKFNTFLFTRTFTTVYM